MDEALILLEADPTSVDFPQRVWWLAALLAERMGQKETGERYKHLAVARVEQEQERLLSRAARARLARAFPWNRAILMASRAGRHKPRD
jgi:hypothetical protein